MTHKVAKFETPLDAVRSYMKNLNTHPAYRGLRTKRSAMRPTAVRSVACRWPRS